MNIVLILFSVFLNSIAQIFLKIWSWKINFNLKYFDIFLSLIFNYYIIFWLLSYALSILLWIYVLSKVQVSYAYPFLSLWFILVIIISYIFLWETINLYKILWILFIVIWVSLIYKFSY